MEKPLFARIWGRTNLVVRLSIAMAVAMLMGAVVLLITSAVQEKAHFSRELGEYLNEEMNTLLITLSEPVVTGDYATIEKMLNDGIKSMRVESIIYTDSSGSRIAAIDRPVVSVAPKYFIRLVDIPTFSKTDTITIGGRNYGTITLQLTTTPLTNYMWSMLVKDMQVLLFALALLLAVTTAIVRFSLRSLVDLAAGARLIGSGDYATRIPEQGAPEMVLTISAFNLMAEQLRQTLDHLKQSRDKYILLHNETPVLLHSIDRAGTLVEVNNYWLKTLGYERDEVLGRKVTDFYADASRKYAQEVVLPAFFRDGFCKNIAYQFVKKNGELVDVLLSATGERDAAGNIVRSLAVIEDITERKRAEEALQKSEKMLQTIIDAEPQCVKVLDENANLIMMNRAGLDMIQVDTFDQVRGQCVCPLVTSEYRPAFMELTKRVCEGESGTLIFEMVGMKGRRLWLETHAVPLRNEKNEITTLLGVTLDITERKRAEEELREKEEKYRLLFESANDGIFIQDEVRFTDCNQKGAEMYGLTKEEIIGRSPGEFAPERQPDGRLSTEVAGEKIRTALSGVPQIFEWQPLRTDGSTFDVEITLSRLELGGKMCLQAIVRDIGERKRSEEEREKLQAQLFQSQKMESVGRLAGGVAHDFNNMLSAILGYTEMAILESTSSETISAYLKVIEQSALRSADLVRQLLAFARKQTVAPKVLDLNDTMAGLLKMLRRLMGEDIDFAWMPGAGLWPVKIDPSQIDQLLANLCVNARDAIAGVGKITIETENAVIDEAYCAVHPGFVPGEYVMLAVSDNGCGMNKEVIDHIFEPFFTTKELGKGTGLGLATVYGIVKQNEGIINVYSEPDKGSTFRIYLPRFAGKVIEPAAASMPETPKGHGETVLLVEDEESILDMSQDMLQALDYRVLTSGTPGEALRQFKAHASEIQLLITDVVMPEMNGRDLAKLLREIQPGLKCLFSSGYTADAIAHQGMLDEGVNFLQKPFSRKDLATKVREVLEQK